MLEEFENPKLLDEPIDKENFIDIMCNIYLDDQIISKLYQTNLVKKILRHRSNKPIYNKTTYSRTRRKNK